MLKFSDVGIFGGFKLLSFPSVNRLYIKQKSHPAMTEKKCLGY